MKVKIIGATLLGFTSIVSTLVTANAGSPFGSDGVFAVLFSDMTKLISGGLIALIIGMTIAMFFWALFRGMLRSQGADDIKKNKDTLIWGIGILFVMVSIWGIIIFFQDAILGPKYKGQTIDLPTIPLSGKSSTGNTNDGNPITPGTTVNSGKKGVGQLCTYDIECTTNYCALEGSVDSSNLVCKVRPSNAQPLP